MCAVRERKRSWIEKRERGQLVKLHDLIFPTITHFAVIIISYENTV